MKAGEAWSKIDRWEEGLDREPDADAIARLIRDLDFEHLEDSFKIRLEGEGESYHSLVCFLESAIADGLIDVQLGGKK